MNILVNNISKDILENSTIESLLQLLEISSTRGLAIAVNSTVISKSEWSEYTLNENDKITLIRATQGG